MKTEKKAIVLKNTEEARENMRFRGFSHLGTAFAIWWVSQTKGHKP